MSFSASLSGLNANQQKLKVIGNNLANLNTVAFKSSTVDFADLVYQSVGGSSANPSQIGLGVTTGSISPNFRQGGIENTGVPTNVAIQGNGFFVIGGEGEAYTRAGNFSFDKDGVLVTPDGRPVMGYTATDIDGNIITTGAPTSIIVPPGVLRSPVTTTQFSALSNLRAGAAVGEEFTASIRVYDSLGAAHVATITYTNTAPGAWDYDVTVPGEEITGGTAGTPFSIGAGNLTFDVNGQLLNVNGAAAADVTIAGPDWANGADAIDVVWDLVDANNNGLLTGFDGARSATSSISQNGSPAATVDSIDINSSGELVATLGAGNAIIVAQLAIANFNTAPGLVKLGSNLYGSSVSAGLPNIGVAGTGGRGTLIGKSLEQSNVDVATEFTQMILAQRGYQASAKGITVADEILQETLNLKR
ncbi:MAG: flagellar hook protein FlgE [Vicinamibacterales bacterium]